jgi:hypothetical protein
MASKRGRALGLVGVVALIAAAAAIGVDTARADVSQTPVETGCPAGFEHLSVALLEAAGPYRLPRLIDSAGNGNGFICGLALPEGARLVRCGPACPVPVLFLFDEDDNAARERAQVSG